MPSLLYQPSQRLKRALREDTLHTDDTTEIYYQYAKQNQNAEIIVFIHGYSEHSDCYLSVMSYFFNQGYHVAALDIRGHGLSSGRRGYIEHFKAYSSDLHQVLTVLQQQCQPKSINLIAHSNGGLLTSYYLLTHEKAHPIHRVVLSAPYLGTHPKLLPIQPIQWTLRQLAKLYPTLSIPKKTKKIQLTHDESILKKIAADKKRLNATSVAWFLAAKEAQDTVFKRAKHWPNIPALIIIAENDVLADNSKTQQFFEIISSKGKMTLTPPDAYHEVLNESDRVSTYELILDWIKSTSNGE